MPTHRQVAALVAAAVLAIAADRGLQDGGGTAARAAATPHSMPAFLRFSGSGSTLLRPDRATIEVSTAGRGASLAAATDTASSAMRRVIAVLRRDGVRPADMQTTDAGGGRRAHGAEPYRARQSLSVLVRDVPATGRLLAAAVGAGASATSGPSFSLASQREGRGRAIAAAVADARAKASAAAAAAGLRVTGVISVTESAGGYPIYAAAGSALGGIRAPLPVPVQHGMQRVESAVTVTFGVQPA
jgi:uncharacterized protein